MKQRLVCIVEGRGEVEAVPNLGVRILHYLERWSWVVDAQPIKQDRSRLVNEKVESPLRPCNVVFLAAAIQIARARAADAVLVLCDSDNDCAVTWNASATALARAHRHWPPVASVMSVREYEGWLLANETTAVLTGIKVQAPEQVRGAKEKLAILYPGYAPTSHQLELTRKIDIARLRRRSRSFEKLVRSIDVLCN